MNPRYQIVSNLETLPNYPVSLFLSEPCCTQKQASQRVLVFFHLVLYSHDEESDFFLIFTSDNPEVVTSSRKSHIGATITTV